MEDFEEAAERRRKKADYIDSRVKDMLWRAMMMNFRLTYNDYQNEVAKRNKKLKKKDVVAIDRDADLENVLADKTTQIAEETAKHIVNFLREQIVKNN